MKKKTWIVMTILVLLVIFTAGILLIKGTCGEKRIFLHMP